MKKLTADQMTSDYMRIRQAVQEKEEEIKKLKVIQAKITDSMLELCDKENIDSLKTAAGTVTRRVISTGLQAKNKYSISVRKPTPK